MALPPPPPPPAAVEEGVLSPSEDETCPEALAKTDIERLSRQRPAALSSAFVEAGFVVTIVLSMMMSEFFIGGFNIILPDTADALNIPNSARTWPAGVINLTTAALLMPFSRMCDLYGARVVFLCGQAWLSAWSLICGFSQNPNMLIICRAMQGIGAAAFLPAGLTLLGQTYRPGPRKNFIFSLYGAFACIGFYVGILIGGIGVQFLNWRWFFWIGAIIVFTVLVSGLLTIPKHLHEHDPTIRMDWWGVCTIVPGLVLVVFAFTDGGHAPQGWSTPYVYVTLIIGVLFLCAAVYVQGWVSAQPLFPADLFRPKYMKRLSGAMFCSYGVFGLYLFYAAFYIEEVLHNGALLTAAWFTPLAVGGMFLAIGGGLALHLLSGRVLMYISGVGFLLSVLLFALIPVQTDGDPSNTFLYWAYVFPAMLCGTIGVDITFNVTNIFITTSLPRRLQGSAGGLINSLLYLGIAFWLGIGEMAVSVTMQTNKDEEFSLRDQYRIGFWVGVALAGVSLCLMSTIKIGQASAQLTADEKAQAAQAEPESQPAA